jgi:hypothetical protein
MPPRNEINGGTQVGIRACGGFPLPQATGVNILIPANQNSAVPSDAITAIFLDQFDS